MTDNVGVPTSSANDASSYDAGALVAGKYRLIRPLGEGGMGTIWLAQNETLDTQVALKLIRTEVQGAEASARLLQEARAAAKLGHRAIVRVYDFGQTEQGDPFLVMEVLEGESFAQVLERRIRLSPAHAVQTLLPVIDALERAHQHGIVHRDLKPDNIFIAVEAGRVQPKIVDFGIAKLEQQREVRSSLTDVGTVLGSPGYMAPEQARGFDDVNALADVWAVCVVLYEAVSGHAAFEGENYNALMRAIIEAPVTPLTHLGAGDEALWQIVQRGLEKDRAQRIASMRDLGVALAHWLLERGIDRDITGEPLDTVWLSVPETKKRDLYSSPPPSSANALAAGRNPFGSLPDTLMGNQAVSGEHPTYRPSGSPESTSAVVRSASLRAPRRLPLLAGAFAVGLAVAVGLAMWLSPEPEPSDDHPASASRTVQSLSPDPASSKGSEEEPPVDEKGSGDERSDEADEASQGEDPGEETEAIRVEPAKPTAKPTKPRGAAEPAPKQRSATEPSLEPPQPAPKPPANRRRPRPRHATPKPPPAEHQQPKPEPEPELDLKNPYD